MKYVNLGRSGLKVSVNEDPQARRPPANRSLRREQES